MKPTKPVPRPIAALLLAATLTAGCATGRHDAGEAGRRIAITVTERGFQPALVTVRAGEPVTLVITRRTDRTCARDFVLAARGIKQPLPLGRPVEIRLTPDSPGDLRFACAMDMVAGTLRVE